MSSFLVYHMVFTFLNFSLGLILDTPTRPRTALSFDISPLSDWLPFFTSYLMFPIEISVGSFLPAEAKRNLQRSNCSPCFNVTIVGKAKYLLRSHKSHNQIIVLYVYRSLFFFKALKKRCFVCTGEPKIKNNDW